MTDDELLQILRTASEAAERAFENALEAHGPYDPESGRDYGPRCLAYVLMPASGRLATIAMRNGFALSPENAASERMIFNPETLGGFFDFWIGALITPAMEAAHRELLRSGERVELFLHELRHPDFAAAGRGKTNHPSVRQNGGI